MRPNQVVDERVNVAGYLGKGDARGMQICHELAFKEQKILDLICSLAEL